MARNRSTNRRRRRGRFSFLTKLLCILLIAGAVVAALTVFFKVQSITVSGNARYTSEEVVAASGIEIEDNLFLLNKYSAAQAIFEKLPYVEEATINRALPDTIVITVWVVPLRLRLLKSSAAVSVWLWRSTVNLLHLRSLPVTWMRQRVSNLSAVVS